MDPIMVHLGSFQSGSDRCVLRVLCKLRMNQSARRDSHLDLLLSPCHKIDTPRTRIVRIQDACQQRQNAISVSRTLFVGCSVLCWSKGGTENRGHALLGVWFSCFRSGTKERVGLGQTPKAKQRAARRAPQLFVGRHRPYSLVKKYFINDMNI